jgi:phosphatidylserine/phosphatidylglycerophosphate/cardiolipin synthase-like enzyme
VSEKLARDQQSRDGFYVAADLHSKGGQAFRDELLHTRSLTVDSDYSLFGSYNIDACRLHLDSEIELAVYDQGFHPDNTVHD